jgi:uncharacterized phage protein (TIGR01671 family)
MQYLGFRAWDIAESRWRDCWIADIYADEAVENDNLIIEQFTGLFDNENEKIFEGDIVYQYTGNSMSKNNGHYPYDKGIVEVVRESSNGGSWEPIAYGKIFGRVRPAWKKVGNIHENPELVPNYVGA